MIAYLSFIFVGCLFSLIADYFLRSQKLISGTVFYALAALPVYFAFRVNQQWILIAILWEAMMVVGGIGLGLISGEVLTLRKSIAILMCLIATILVEK